jgi:hypothetical protein
VTDALPRKEEAPPGGPETFWARVWATLLTPFQAFRHHDPTWGWWQPWLLVAVIGVTAGGISLAKVDHEDWQEKQWQRLLDQMPPAKRKQMEKPEVAEGMAKFRRFQTFLTKASKVAGPPLVGLLGLVFAAFWLFLAARFVGPEPAELARCMSIAAYCSLANLIAYAGEAWGSLQGNPQASSSLAALSDPLEQPVLAAALSRVDPAVWAYYLFFAAGLAGSCRLSKGRALGVTFTLFVLSSLALVGLAGLGQLGASFQGG